MKVIKNCKMSNSLFPMRLTCDGCQSIIEADAEDITLNNEFLYCTVCPVCHNIIWLEEPISFPMESLHYPQHYYDFTDGIDISNKHIDDNVKRLITYLKDNPDELYIDICVGNTYIVVYKIEEKDKISYTIIVSKSHFKAIVEE